MEGAISRARTLTLTALAMLAFAANSILCRAALAWGGADPATFTIVRVVSPLSAVRIVQSFVGAMTCKYASAPAILDAQIIIPSL